jgi:hypothetical protein
VNGRLEQLDIFNNSMSEAGKKKMKARTPKP